MTEEQSPLSQEEEPLPLLLYADVSIDVIRARNLPRGLLAPRAQVLVFCPFIEQPIATTDSAPRCTAPEWNFSEKIVLPHLPSALPLIKFVVVDTSAGQSTFGSASISLSAPATRAYIPLDAPATRADLLVSVRWHSCPFPVSPLLPRPLASADSAAAGGPELRAVDPRPGAIFRTGSILVEVTAAGIPASVAQPFLHVRTSDQILRGGETVHSREWWDRRYQREQLQSSDSKTSSDISSDALFTPKASYDSASSPTELEHSNNVSSDGVHFDDGETLANANVSGDNEILPNANASGDNDTLPNVNASIDDEGQGDCNKGKPYTLSGHKSLRQGLRQKVSQLLKEGIVDEKLEKLENMKKNAENIKKKLNKTSLDSLQNARPTRSAIGATVTAAKVRRGKSNKTDRQVPSSQPSASPPQKTPASVLQTLLAPRVRRSVDFGSFEFAEFTIGPPKRLSLKITDKDSHLPSALGAVFETDLPLDLLETGESSIVLTTCENGPVRAKVSIWVRITRLRDADACPAPVNIVTPKFMQVLDDSERLAADFKTKYTQAERLTYLFVGGLFTNHYPLYFSRNVDYLQQKLLLPRVQCIPINTESGLAANAKVIAASVAKTATRRNSVVLIGHSKGGCDILHAVTHHIEIIPFIHGIISFQAPFLGTYAVDVYKRNILADAIGSAIETLWHGERQSLLDMCYSTREACLSMFGKKEADVEGTNAMVLRDIPIVTVASHASFKLQSVRSVANVAGIASMSLIAGQITANTGFFNDGLVVWADALVPFSDAIYLDDMMHTEPALYVPGTKYPPGELTAAALSLLFDKANRATKKGN